MIVESEMFGFYELAKNNMEMSKSLISDCFTSTSINDENLLFEYTKLFSNSKMFKDYMIDFINRKSPDESGDIPVYIEELAAITKCIFSMLDSKKQLKSYGIILDKQ